MLTFLARNTFPNVRNSAREFCVTQRKNSALPQLSPYDVNCILRENEFSYNFSNGSVKSYDSNQLGSNYPIEDSRSEASLTLKNGLLFGVFDGHGGPSCSQVISKRLLRYLAVSLLDRETLKEQIKESKKSPDFLKCYNDKVDFVKEVKDLYEESFQKYANDLCNKSVKHFDFGEILETAFLRLDNDLSEEALKHMNIRTLSVAMSGAVTCVALIQDQQLYIGNTGDCCAVIGGVNDNGQWVAKQITQEHNTENIPEVQRILDEHPPNEKNTVIRNDRLLGQLAPLRAFGDFRYKWPNDILQRIVVPQFGELSMPPHYYTPPYLTARPDITHHTLSTNDRFLVIGSDGLWDFLTPTQVVNLVGEHIAGKAILEPLVLPEKQVTLGQIENILQLRKIGRKKKPIDTNAATHLIRNALGGTEYGIEHSKLSHLLSLPQDVVRLFRDDITITVIYFDQDYLSNNPSQ